MATTRNINQSNWNSYFVDTIVIDASDISQNIHYTLDEDITIDTSNVSLYLPSSSSFNGNNNTIFLGNCNTNGLFTVSHSKTYDSDSFINAPDISNIIVDGGTVNIRGGFIVPSHSKYFKINNCHVNGNLSKFSGAIVGSHSGISGGECHISYSSYSSESTTMEACGSIVGPYCAAKNGTCTVDNCTYNGMTCFKSGGIVGSYAGFLGGNVTITNCNVNGEVKNGSGGIVGNYAGFKGTIQIDGCSANVSGDPSNNDLTNSGAICGMYTSIDGVCVIRNCYNLGNAPLVGSYSGTDQDNSSIIIQNSYVLLDSSNSFVGIKSIEPELQGVYYYNDISNTDLSTTLNQTRLSESGLYSSDANNTQYIKDISNNIFIFV